MEYDIFISYSRKDLEKVKSIKADIESETSADCWMDLDGIESGEQFEKVIIFAINRSSIFLFMLSQNSIKSEWTLDELDFAKRKGKRLVIVAIENVVMSDIFYFRYHKYDQIDWNSHSQREKLLRDIRKWIGKTDGNTYRDQITKTTEESIENTSVKQNANLHFIKRWWRWLLVCVSLLVVIFILYSLQGSNETNNNLESRTSHIDSIVTSTMGVLKKTDKTELIDRPQIPSDFVLVPGGTLSYKGNYYENYKMHNVEIDSFFICKFELTQGEYKRVVGDINKDNYSWYSWGQTGQIYTEIRGDSLPVRGVLKDFASYCNLRSTQEGYEGFYDISGNTVRIKANGDGYRLITAYEWVFAAYGGNKNKKDKFLGGNNLSDVAWHLGNSKNRPHPVGLKKPNVIGLYDIQGNVSELLQGDNKHKTYCSMVGDYAVSNWNYPQTFDPTYIISIDDEYISERNYGTRIAFVPPSINNHNLEIQYDYSY